MTSDHKNILFEEEEEKIKFIKSEILYFTFLSFKCSLNKFIQKYLKLKLLLHA